VDAAHVLVQAKAKVNAVDKVLTHQERISDVT
jgi:hypothetical protein